MENQKPALGTIAWHDYTSNHADEMKEFYENVFNWTSDGIPMKDGEEEYEDFVMKTAEGNVVGGICNHRGKNTGIPAQWMVYITVENPQETAEKAVQLGGKIIKEYHDKEGNLMYAMIEDPIGTVFGIAKSN
ncbi:VOC family protein [Moheibacter lacus]|uniref:VOC family protein n=1 Tax=Moheibacter lacus TaxID=2745851 RepID=A0A838ZT93_9FLAO|nr:VOC family protein [Moheibacter lacus]MBA5630201.1 VOC family protein [Moheibacter lacus]